MAAAVKWLFLHHQHERKFATAFARFESGMRHQMVG